MTRKPLEHAYKTDQNSRQMKGNFSSSKMYNKQGKYKAANLNNNYFRNSFGNNSNLNYNSGLYKNKSQPPVACYPVTVTINNQDEQDKLNIYNKNYKNTIDDNKKSFIKNHFSKNNNNYVNPVKYENYSKVYKPITQNSNISIESSKFNISNINKKECCFDSSEFPTIENMDKADNMNSINIIDSLKVNDSNIDNNENNSSFSVEHGYNHLKSNDNTFPFPSDIRQIYVTMYNEYQIYEKKMLEIIASQNKINISSFNSENVYSNEDIKKYLYMLFTQSFGPFIQFMSLNKESQKKNDVDTDILVNGLNSVSINSKKNDEKINLDNNSKSKCFTLKKKSLPPSESIYQPPYIREKEKNENYKRARPKSLNENSKFKNSIVISSTGTGRITLNKDQNQKNLR